MSKYTGPKVRVARKLGVALTPKAAKVMEKKPYPPGMHGPAKQFSRSRPSPYKEQLIEKQKLRAQYNVHEKQMVNYYKKAQKQEGNTGENLLQLLESRLDAIVLRGNLARTIYAARQYVNHCHILVNGKRVNIPSYSVRVGDVIEVRPKSQKMEMFQNALSGGIRTPGYISVDEAKFSITVMADPSEVVVFADVSKVVEFYSR